MNEKWRCPTKKAARLFDRNQGNEERSDLWYQVGGILQ